MGDHGDELGQASVPCVWYQEIKGTRKKVEVAVNWVTSVAFSALFVKEIGCVFFLTLLLRKVKGIFPMD